MDNRFVTVFTRIVGVVTIVLIAALGLLWMRDRARPRSEPRWEPFEALSTGRRVRSIARFLHTGEALGFAGQTIAGLVSLGGAFLVWTGLALAYRRFFSRTHAEEGRERAAA